MVDAFYLVGGWPTGRAGRVEAAVLAAGAAALVLVRLGDGAPGSRWRRSGRAGWCSREPGVGGRLP